MIPQDGNGTRMQIASARVIAKSRPSAENLAEFGPRAPKRIETWPAARLMMAEGMKKGEILRGPPCIRLACSRSMISNPPMPEPIKQPTRSAISGEISSPAWVIASWVAAKAK